VDVDAIDRARAGALVAADAGRQVEAMEAPIARPDRDRQLRVLEELGKRFASVRLEEVPQGDVHALTDSLDGQVDVAKPLTHRGLAELPPQVRSGSWLRSSLYEWLNPPQGGPEYGTREPAP